MPTLYRPRIVTYRLADGSYYTAAGKRVTKKSAGAVKEVSKAKNWYGRFRDRNGNPVQVKLEVSKETSQRMLLKLANDASLAKVGIEDKYAEHRKRPLLEHLEDFGRYLAGKDRVEEYVARTVAQVKAIIEGCGWKSFADMEPTAVVEHLDGLRGGEARPTLPPRMGTFTAQDLALMLQVKAASIWRMVRRGQLDCTGKGRKRHFTRSAVEACLDARRGPGVSTSNHYLQAIKQFSRWLWRNKRAPDDALVSLSRQNAKVDVRRKRRALSERLFTRFVGATAAGKPFRGLTGHDRLVIYTLAANTGLRASELGSLTPGSFRLDVPELVVEAGYSKHRREDRQPLRPDVATMMATYITGKPKKEPLWPGAWTKTAAEMVRQDLVAAGIPYQDDDGRYFDFHATRGQFISSLASKGVHPKVAQILARHGTIGQTMDNYTHGNVLDVAGALDKLPPLPVEPEQAISLAK